MKERPPIRRVAESILNKHLRTRGGPPALGLCEVLTTPHVKNWFYYEMNSFASSLN